MKPQHNSTTGLSLAVIFSLFVCLITNTAYAQSSLKTETVVANNGAITTSVAANYDSKVKADKKVVEEFAAINERERLVRSAIAKLEADILRHFVKQGVSADV